MPGGNIFVVQGDITQLSADAVVMSASVWQENTGNAYAAFARNLPLFVREREKHPRACKVLHLGEAYWVPLARKKPPYGVVVVAATENQQGDGNASWLAVTNSAQVAVEQLRPVQQDKTKRLLIAMPAFRMGEGGSRDERLAAAREQIEAAAAFLKQHSDVDIAFIAYNPDVYGIYRQARAEKDQTPPDEGMTVDPRLVQAVTRGECVYFLGAGLSKGAGALGYPDLITNMAGILKLDPPADGGVDAYLDVAQWFRETQGPGAMGKLIRETFGNNSPEEGVAPGLAHYLILNLPAHHVVTTNYDDLLERTLIGLKRYPVKVVGPAQVAATGSRDGVNVIKLHGDIGDAENVVVSRDDYDDFFRRRPEMASLLEGLLLNQTFLFVGYSLRDPNFRQIFSRIHHILRGAHRPAFAITFEAITQHGKRQWERKGLHVITIPGNDAEEQSVRLLRLLDGLNAATASGGRLFLASDVKDETVKELPRLGDLREVLCQVGKEFERLDLKSLNREEAKKAGEVLAFLTGQGWRSCQGGAPGKSPSETWLKLADRLGENDRDDRRRMLIAALASAESLDRRDRIVKKLEVLEPAVSGDVARSGG